MATHLILRFDAPMLAFGGEVIDSYGVVRDFPARSMLTGLVANALGLDRAEAKALDRLQSRIVHASARVAEGRRMREYQTARLFERDAGWTTRAVPEGRATSPSFGWDARYEAERGERRKSLTHQRHRDFDADARVLVALRLEPADEAPDINAVATALERPARPLFIGRKAFLPASPILSGRCEAADTLAALAGAMQPGAARVEWGEPIEAALPGARIVRDGHALSLRRRHRVGDERRHVAGIHSGTREVFEGLLERLPTESAA